MTKDVSGKINEGVLKKSTPFSLQYDFYYYLCIANKKINIIMKTQVNDQTIIDNAKQRGIEFDAFCLINFVREQENNNKSLDDIIDEYEQLKDY